MSGTVLVFPSARLGGGLAFAEDRAPVPVGHLDVAPVSFVMAAPSWPVLGFAKPALTAGIDGHAGAFGGVGVEMGAFAVLGRDAQLSVSVAGVGYATTRGVRGGAVVSMGRSIFSGFVAYHADAALFGKDSGTLSHQISAGFKFGF